MSLGENKHMKSPIRLWQRGLVGMLMITVLLTVPQPVTACPWYNPRCWVEKTWSGIKSGAGWAWKGAKTASSALRTAASKSWKGAQMLGAWIEKGAEWSADQFVEACRRNLKATYQQVNARVNSLVIMGYGTLESVKIVKEGLEELAKGNLVDGTTALYVGLAKFSHEMPLDVLSSEALETLSALQTALFLEPEGRFLTAEEKSYLAWVFWGGEWWLNLIRVKEGFSGLWSLNPRPFTVETTIYLKNWPSEKHLAPAQREALMVHETTHVWQYIHGGGDYKLASLYYQATQGDDAYTWEPAVNMGHAWGSLNPEQQANFVERAYESGCYANYYNTCFINDRYGTPLDRDTFFRSVDNQIINGQGAP